MVALFNRHFSSYTSQGGIGYWRIKKGASIRTPTATHCSDAKDRRLLIRPLLVQLDILIEHDTVSAERRADALCTLS
jgi:hypothetical protein